jgi:lipoprotein-releasing system permease protein|tara:strand:+ start:113 stop:1357 length:1245 start_codon:yes stop_codon:yes gene_type:complete
MNNVSLLIALRYFRSKRSGFVSIISKMAFAGIAIGVAVLIIVTSVMNGFEKELQTRILQAIPHASIEGNISNDDIDEIVNTLYENKKIVGAAPYIETQGLVSSGSSLKGVYIYGVNPSEEPSISIVSEQMIDGTWNSLSEDGYNLLMGDILAVQLGLRLGDKVNVLVPDTNLGLAGILPRTRQFTVSGIFSLGAPEMDESFVYLNIKNASKLLRMNNSVHGIRVRYSDLFLAPTEIYKDLFRIQNSLNINVGANDWTRSYGTLFKAIKNEKFLISLLLTFIVLVAIFNVVSMLVMIINEKRAQIAVLVTLGGTRRFIQKIFIYFGSLIGIFGTLSGLLIGLLITYNLGSIIGLLEYTFGVKFLEVYFIDYFPVDIRPAWIFFICTGSLLLTIISSIYPATIASKVEPAEVLKYE